MSNSTKLAMSTQEEREITVQIVSNFCRRANNSDYSLEDILAMDDDMLNLYITINNNLDAESGAKVLEAVQYRPKYPRRVSVSVRASYPRRIVRGELCSERL